MRLVVKCALEAPKSQFSEIGRHQGMLPRLRVGGELLVVGHLGRRGVLRSAVLADIKNLCGRPAPRGVAFEDEWVLDVEPSDVSGFAWSGSMLDSFPWKPGDTLNDGEFLATWLSDSVLAEVETL